ncbi:hypothetical protein [Leclercia tamurae]|uniref:hypothetical protein n=1 Tax=Leclercia tamurae TaxID=2926467 RepID=UPI0036F48E76
MDKVKINHLPALAVIRPEYMCEAIIPIPTTKERIIGRIYQMEFYIKVAIIWAIWIGLVIWGGEYIASK